MTVADSDAAVAPAQALPEGWAAAPFLQRSAKLGEPEKPDDGADLAAWQAYFRRARRYHTAAIATANLSGAMDSWQTIEALSSLADRLLAEAAQFAEREVQTVHGQFPGPAGEPIGLGIVAMGKLGGFELNFSSDVDLVFVYARPQAEQSDGERPLDPARYFAKQAQCLIKLLEPPTADGFAYRVDARLRPFGTAGPLAVSASAWVQYYESHGRTWERYALIKARPVVDPNGAVAAALDHLNPFVYRRHLDFTAIESLRAVHAEIAADVQRKDAEGDLKRGRGGIREAEFVLQVLQLIWGGGLLGLRTASWREALDCLVEHDKFAPDDAQTLLAAYDILRQVENRVQMWDDRQTHSLPEAEDAQAALAAAFDAPDYAALLDTLDAHRDGVWHLFSTVVGEDPAQRDSGGAATLIDTPTGATATQVLERFGLYGDAIEPAQQAAQALRDHPGLQGDSRRRLRRVWPRLLGHERVRSSEDIRRLHDFIDAIAGRSTYLALLDERPDAAEQLVTLLTASPAIASQLTASPAVLDELLDPRVLYAPPELEELREQLADLVANADDEEGRLDALREFRNRQTLRVAAAEITGALPLMKVSDHLSWIAEAVIDSAVRLSGDDMQVRHGSLPDSPTLAVIAYGKLGGLEVNYGSDLDLVFLYDADAEASSDGPRSLSAEAYMIRWSQRLIHWLTTRTREGDGYEVDIRLRPSGNAGLMVSRIAAFEKYQQKRAWTWEHQALVRARLVSGPDALGESFAAIRRQVLQTSRELEPLASDIRDMRAKLRAQWHKDEPGQFDLKHGLGGIMDLEFLVQYLVLANAHAHPAVAEYSDNVRQLEALGSEGVLVQDDAKALTSAYLDYRSRWHELTLQEARMQIDQADFEDHRALVARHWARHLDGADA